MWLRPRLAGREADRAAATLPAVVVPAGATAQSQGSLAVQPLVSGETKPESKSLTTQPDKVAELKLKDGTAVSIPRLPQRIGLTLARESNTLDLAETGQESTGSMRVLTYQAADMTGFQPTITIPANEVGALETVNIVRRGDLLIEGELLADQTMFMPAKRDADGNLVFLDYWMPYAPPTQAPQTLSPERLWREAEGLASRALLLRVAAQEPKSDGGSVTYGATTYQSSPNWGLDPYLLRMVPDASADNRRVPLFELSEEKRKAELAKPVQNVIILVHGHNEAERMGFSPPTAQEPWWFEYKRDVWTLLYDEVLLRHSEAISCTAFYEFVYPTFRPIWNANLGAPPLGPALANALANDTPLAQMTAAGRDYNLYFVAHSMGGLVSRAGINALNADLDKRFRKLVTWGAPHHGAPLVTLRYLLGEGYDHTGTSVPLPIVGQQQWFIDALNSSALDTPGEQDLRWDNYRPLNLRAQGWTESKGQVTNVNKETELEKNPVLQNNDLAAFNKSDKHLLSNKYYALYGVTAKQIRKQEWTLRANEAARKGIKKAVADELARNGIAIGRALTQWIYNNPDTLSASYSPQRRVNESDGAVPVDSAAGVGIVPPANALNIVDLDHEEFYGAPDLEGKLRERTKGVAVAAKTLDILALTEPTCACPKLTLLQPKPQMSFAATTGITVPVEARLEWPAVANPWQQVKKAEAQVEVNQTKNVASYPLTVPVTGTLKGEVQTSEIGEGAHKLRVKLYFKDGSELLSDPAVPFTISSMGVTEVRPTKGLPDDPVWIMGTGLGVTGTVTINGVVAPVKEWKADMITIAVPKGATSGDLVVTVGKWTSAPVPFEVLTVLTILQKANVFQPQLNAWGTFEGLGSQAGAPYPYSAWLWFRGGDLKSPGKLVWKGNTFEQIVTYGGDENEQVTETVTGAFTPDGQMLATLSCSREGVMAYPPNDNYATTLTTVFAFEAISIPMRISDNAQCGLPCFERGDIGGFDYYNVESADIAKYIKSASWQSTWVEEPKIADRQRVEGGSRLKTWDYANAEHKPQLVIRFEYRK